MIRIADPSNLGTALRDIRNVLGYNQLAALRRNAPSAVPSEPQAAEQPSAQGADGNGPETGTAGATDERAREDT